jgi:acyl-CoA synthetase (AMP-forming)/AMP-acid ligase II
MSYDLTGAHDIVTVLRQHAVERTDTEALSFLANPDDLQGGLVRWSFGELDIQARTRAAWLQQRLAPGSRVLLLYPNGLEFAATFLGCVYAGMIAVPAPEPGRQRHHRIRAARIADNAEVSAILTPSAKLAEIQEWAAASDLGHLIVAATDVLDLADPLGWNPPPMNRSTTAVLQYTSGSTGDPKGVVVSHDNILFNLNIGAAAVGWPPSARLGGWLPFYHDMALQALFLASILRGGSCLLMDPISFLRKPLRWLQVIDIHDLSVTFAPNFAYDLCLRKIDDEEVKRLDLSRLEIAGTASEPVDPVVLAEFTRKFAPAGFRPDAFAPTYGMAEATAYISGLGRRTPRIHRVDLGKLSKGTFAEPIADLPTRDVVSCGPPNEACEIRIVDPATHAALAEGQLGEIWLRGRSIASGYWGMDSSETFDAATTDGQRGYFRTGDLGAIYTGELHVHGRLKDVLVVRGRNIYSSDVEQELRRQHPKLGKVGAVFSGLATDIGAADAHDVVVTHEVIHLEHEELATLAAEIRHTVGREFGVHVGTVLLLRPGSVLRTTSGKVQRSAMRELFREGRLTPLYQDPPAAVTANQS